MRCRGRCPHRPTQTAPILRKSSANSKLPDGPMWASAPTAACANAYEFAENQYKICSALLHDLSDSASPSHLPFQGRLGCGSICFSSDTPAPDRAPSARSGSCSENGFEIIAESIMTENGKYYEIMVAEAGHMSLSDKEVRFGPHLMKDQSQVFQLKWQREINKLEIALGSIPLANQTDRAAIEDKIQTIKEVLNYVS